ncbi:MAG TPA: ATP synthase F0 subunit B [Terriglobales bacterium]|jgi:F-type H+-transporting ATPase subunit b|nr:ATP synthase F0 subunit B [Terriglobales bacterium]
MKNRRFRFLFLLLAFATCLTLRSGAYPQASAEEGGRTEQNAPANESSKPEAKGEGTEQFKHSGSVRLLSRITGLSLEGAYWLAVLINFAIVAGVIVWASRKNLPAIFRNRTTSIQKSIEEARRASEDANQRLAQIEARLSRLDDDIAQMRVTSEKEAAAEEQRIQQAAEEDAKRIVESAEQEISAAAKAARRELTFYAADLAVSLAAKQIRVDAPTDQALVRQFASQLANAGNGKKA